jgi:site-specific recombinase XerD
MANWIKAAEGVRYKEHATRKNGVGFDRYYAIYFRIDGKQHEQGLGWGSKGVTLDYAKKILNELRNNYLAGAGPATLKAKRQLKADAEAEESRQKVIAELENTTFRDFFQNSYLPIQKTHKPKTTWVKESGHAENWLFPVAGDVPIKNISQFHIERIKKLLIDAGKAPRTIQHCLATFRQVWNHARRAGVVTGDSPTRAVKIPKFDNQRQRFLTDDECENLLSALRKRSLETYRFSVLSLDAGLRFSEAAGLTWGDVDVCRETLLLLDTKSGRNRTVYMTERIRTMFSEMKRGAGDSLIFPGPGGKQRIEIGDIFEIVVCEIGLNVGVSDARMKAVFHTLRHTHASRLLEAGTDIYLVKTLLGHRNITTTERYLHVKADNLRSAVKKMENMKRGQGGQLIQMVK